MFHVKHFKLTKYSKRKSLIRMRVTKAITNLFAISMMILCTSVTGLLYSQKDRQFSDPFKQLYEVLPTPNTYRTASGAPGHEYWQQRADYEMKIRIDDKTQRLYGEQTIHYHNNSPDKLEYLWLQLDQNMRARDSDTKLINSETIGEKVNFKAYLNPADEYDGGFKITAVTDLNGHPLHYTINKTMLRIDMPQALKSGESFSFKMQWWYNINNRATIGGRAGYEYFEEDDNYLYTIAQYYPRMCAYLDNIGWQNKQFLGRGEFTLSFGDYDVSITVPEDHLVAATGTLQNADEILPKQKSKLLQKAKSSFDTPLMIYTENEAVKREKGKARAEKTWHFKAKDVRDFAFASSRKFIWDAMGVPQSNGDTILAMSMYPKEGNPLWEKYSTKAVAHTLKWYSHYTFDYPYPVAWSIHTDRIGMEYPMISFNGGRPEKDGTYSERTKYGMISVIIHEVGHNYFPMIVNSDERQWTWMDEGLNSFLQYLSEQQWERDYPSWRGPAENITSYMASDPDQLAPIMTNSESIFQFGNNAYGKPATALNILRETIMGRELFDHAFKTYANRWKFKHPSPADFFRTMEDASGVDLDWFWRAWFYTTQYVDQAIANVTEYQLDPLKNVLDQKDKSSYRSKGIASIRNRESIPQTYAEKDTTLFDFYNDYDDRKFDPVDRKNYEEFLNSLSKEEKKLLEKELYIYQVDIENLGGLVMPIILKIEYEDNTEEFHRIPAEIWRFDDKIVSKTFKTSKKVRSFTLDPYLEIADIDKSNNHFPPVINKTKFELYKEKMQDRQNPMQRALEKK